MSASTIVFDVETTPLLSAMDYLDIEAFEKIEPPGNYTKDEAKANYITREKERLTREHMEKAALDPDLCRVVVLGWLDVAKAEPVLLRCEDEDAEAAALIRFWSAARDADLVGFNVLQFDLPVLYRRSLYLNVRSPFIQRERYRHARVHDLLDILCEQGRLKMRSVGFYAKRFGIKNDDPVKGKDVPKLIADGQWDAVVNHCRCDLFTERAIAERLGVVQPMPESAVASATHGRVRPLRRLGRQRSSDRVEVPRPGEAARDGSAPGSRRGVGTAGSA